MTSVMRAMVARSTGADDNGLAMPQMPHMIS
jgi:hypothetical protein